MVDKDGGADEPLRLGESADWPPAPTDYWCHGDFATAIGFGLDRYASEPELRCMAFGTSAAASWSGHGLDPVVVVPHVARISFAATSHIGNNDNGFIPLATARDVILETFLV